MLRNEFYAVTRKNFLKELGKIPKLLKTQGLSDIDEFNHIGFRKGESSFEEMKEAEKGIPFTAE